ncbi:2-oxo acid dehydrogenase subunit E2 [Oceanobacillus piezotolerans]|uniref:Dihydrolipoamide acetyltransferase component of pyruvate dehydrogenase complex n=1 Tax=Oceanobacillus piezotolerans TaxID=2448030 RepID=A0A498D9X2_9BACI|nr:dihydrolipoamide acetyltransferase family protein [Oceanobacillus piezotolerans]RLL48133.1 2-oxo acid dehydrogenase subunit E2 [Oceanobacillus piezotolerans]
MTTEKITMPQLGESVTEGTISTWLVSVGDKVNKYDPIAEVLTDKVNAEVPSSFTGKIVELTVEEGKTVAVGDVICIIEVEGNDSVTTEHENKENVVLEKQNTDHTDHSMKKRYSPAVLRLAQENDIDLTSVMGTGRGGRITRKDIEKLLETGITNSTNNPSQPRESHESNKGKSTAPAESVSAALDGDIEIPVTGVRRAISEKMVRSKQEIPHAWMTVEVDVTDLVSFRDSKKDEFKRKEGFNLTYFAFFVKAVATALKKYPQLNSTWAGDKIIQRKDVHLSIAVAANDSLFVPVIKHADEKSIKGIARDIHELAMKAREKRLTQEDIQGGTFTVNNTGSFGSIQSMGIINHPQAAILQVESIVKRPVIINNMFAARDMVNLCLSLDHRILDGLICGQFLREIKQTLEKMNEDTISIY